jgi:hypothetical protein
VRASKYSIIDIIDKYAEFKSPGGKNKLNLDEVIDRYTKGDHKKVILCLKSRTSTTLIHDSLLTEFSSEIAYDGHVIHKLAFTYPTTTTNYLKTTPMSRTSLPVELPSTDQVKLSSNTYGKDWWVYEQR